MTLLFAFALLFDMVRPFEPVMVVVASKTYMSVLSPTLRTMHTLLPAVRAH